ncbi:MAG: acetate kinase [Chloroflexi bacterium]|nr:MAG: acetate kinase [Chloroflexota bacterium]PIE79860.1 MAG: acetate kinase [Chloroflexota bacterium]
MILTINCGSSTLKYQLFSTDVDQVLATGIVARIGEDGSYFKQDANGRSHHELHVINSHHEAFNACINSLLHPEYGAIQSIDEIKAVGHRAVHGADLFIESTLIDDDVIAKMEECIPLAPLHNPPNLIGIKEAQSLLPNVPHVAVFDTAFNQTLAPRAYIYSLPYALYENHKIRKYGFHGTSVRYVSRRAAAVWKRPLSTLKMVVFHLGNGVTMTAVSGGKAVDTSIGFATFSGVMMGTRSGDIDPGLIFHMYREMDMSMAEIEQMVYKESGFLGISGVSNDVRVVEQEAAKGNERCQLALEKFAFMAKKYCGSFAAAMGGLDALVFTAGIGENSPTIRQMICDDLQFLGVEVDAELNAKAIGGKAEMEIGCGQTAVLVIPTNEEKMIALDTKEIAKI